MHPMYVATRKRSAVYLMLSSITKTNFTLTLFLSFLVLSCLVLSCIGKLNPIYYINKALGLGIRGRTAIRKADDTSESSSSVWNAVKSRGYESERFRLHLNLPIINKDLVIPLRSEQQKKKQQNDNDDDDDDNDYDEPSLLTFQSELCSALLEKLELRYLSQNDNDEDEDSRLKILFDTKFIDCDYDNMRINIVKNENDENEESNELFETIGPYDLVIGCDGVNSQVRNSIDNVFTNFISTKDRLPGLFKVVRLNSVPTKDVDPTAVSLLFPSGAFIEPTDQDGGCCILFSSSGSGSSSLPLYLTETNNITAVADALRITFPKWDDTSYSDIANQLVSQTSPNSAYAVQCNTYHYKNKAVLVGDAAHATGGVSGQGVNSALVDSVVLAECIQQQYYNNNKEEEDARLEHALMNYSIRQLPEGKALYDLSFGPNPKGIRNKLKWGFKNIKDALFRGKILGIGELPLQTRLSSELTSFADIRRERDEYYINNNNDDEDDDDESQRFPSDQEFRQQLMLLHRHLGKE
jgi:kynurenine 3-monooxygenase